MMMMHREWMRVKYTSSDSLAQILQDEERMYACALAAMTRHAHRPVARDTTSGVSVADVGWTRMFSLRPSALCGVYVADEIDGNVSCVARATLACIGHDFHVYSMYGNSYRHVIHVIQWIKDTVEEMDKTHPFATVYIYFLPIHHEGIRMFLENDFEFAFLSNEYRFDGHTPKFHNTITLQYCPHRKVVREKYMRDVLKDKMHINQQLAATLIDSRLSEQRTRAVFAFSADKHQLQDRKSVV